MIALEYRWQDVAFVAVLVPTISLLAVYIAKQMARLVRWVGHSFTNKMKEMFAQVVVEVMAPDMAHIGTKIASSIDDLRVTNTADHKETSRRLGGVENRQTDVESRLAAVENKLGMRAPDARTRSTDPEEP